VNKTLLSLLTAMVLAGLTPLQAQDDSEAPKKGVPKAVHEAKAKAVAKKAQAKAKAEAELRAKAVDINRATTDQLKKLPGITDAYAEAIIKNRPYHSKADLVTKNILPMGLFQTLRKQVAAK
jgi:DNA uptake protein ComE-like DNA-binding protein